MYRWLFLLCSGCQVLFPLHDDRDVPPDLVGCQDSDLLACFPFNGDTEDATGRNSVITDMVQLLPEEGVEGDAVRTIATSRIDFDQPILTAETELTLEAWVRPQGASNDDQIILDLHTCWGLALSTGLRIKCSGADGVAVETPSAIPRDQWSHVACTQVDDTIEIFVNGESKVSEGGHSIQFAGCTEAAIAGDAPRTTEPQPGAFLGILDRVRIWNRALLAIEIKDEFDDLAP